MAEGSSVGSLRLGGGHARIRDRFPRSKLELIKMSAGNKFTDGMGVGLGSALGVLVGFLVGQKTGNTMRSVAIGLALGVALGAILDLRNRPK